MAVAREDLKLIDTHAHLHWRDYDPDREELLAQYQRDGLGVITIGVDIASSQAEVALAQKWPLVWAGVGVHPSPEPGTELPDPQEAEVALRELLEHPKVVCVGETGFDYYRVPEELLNNRKQHQQALFEMQLKLAVEFDKPVMIHCRDSERGVYDAMEDVLAVLERTKQEYGEGLRGQAHFFSGTPEHAQRYLKLGFMVSFTGVITFTDEYDEAIRSVPNVRLLAETDAPFVAPAPYRGQRCVSTHVGEVVKRLAELKGKSVPEMTELTLANALSFYQL